MFSALFGFLGLSGVFSSVAKVFASAFESITPLLKGLSELIVWFVKTLWEGFKDVVDNLSTVIFVLTTILVSYTLTKVETKKEEAIVCEQQKAELKKDKRPGQKQKASARERAIFTNPLGR